MEKDRDVRCQSSAELRADLKRLKRDSESGKTAATGAVSPVGGKRNLWLGVGALFVVLAGITVGVYYWLAPKAVPFQKTEITQLTTSGKVTLAAISPDGRYVAYATGEVSFVGGEAIGGEPLDREALWVRQVGTGSDVQIVPAADVRYGGLTFSRDGNFLYVTQSESKDGSLGVLYKMPVLGGTKKRLIVDVNIGRYFVNPVTLSPDRNRLAFLRDSKAGNETALMVANEDGSEEKQLAVRKWPNDFGDSVAWSPNGKTIAVAVDNFEAGVTYASLVEVPVQGGAEHPLTQKRWLAVPDLAWVPDGRGLVAQTQERMEGLAPIVYVSYANGETRRITSDLNYYGNVSVTADSRVVATIQSEWPFDVWVAPMAALDSAKPITSDGRGDWPTWSPDGTVAYSNYADGNIWLMRPDGSNRKQFTSNAESFYPRISPDGHYIVFNSERSGSLQIWRMDSDGNNPKQLTDSPFQNPRSDCSPDGKWVVYSRWGSEKGVWKVSMEGGNAVRLSDTDAHVPTVSPDGKMIAYSYQDAGASPWASPPRGIAIMAFEGGPPTKRFDIPNGELTAFRWAADGRSLLYSKSEGGVSNLWSQPIAGGTPKQITHFNNEEIDDFDVSRDGKRLVMSRGTPKQDVVLIRDLR